MDRFLAPAAIFISVMFVGTVCEHFGVDRYVKFGVLCLVAIIVQVAVMRYQRSRQHSTPR